MDDYDLETRFNYIFLVLIVDHLRSSRGLSARPWMRYRRRMRILFVVAVLAGAGGVARAGTLTVGPGRQYATPCEAIAAAQAGDVIEVDAGHYDGDTCAWSTDNLTVRGVGGRAVIDLTGVTPAQQKGIFTIYAENATIENFELSHAAISEEAGNNGAGIRHQGTNLTVRDCYLHDNQDGILGAPAAAGTGTVIIERTELADNGAGDGQSHNAYLNHYASVTLRESYSHGAVVGHLFKTRAAENFILYNRLTDEDGTTASYELDVPNGGTTFVIGNLIEQSAASQNGGIVEYAAEGATNPDQHLYLVNNTVVNDRAAGVFLNLNGAPTALVANNLFVGPGSLPAASASVTLDHDWTDADGDPMLVGRATFDYHLAAGSPAVDRGAPLAMAGAMSLVPDRQYVHPRSSEARAVAGTAIDVGAYELGGAVGPDAGTGPDGGATADDGGGGCGCRSSSRGGGGALVLALVALGWLRRSSRARSRRA